MQETLALGAIVLSLLSYVMVATGPSEAASRAVVQRPVEVLEISDLSRRIGAADEVIPVRQANNACVSGGPAEVQVEPHQALLPPSSSGAAYPWRVTPAPRTSGRVVFTWLSGSPDDRGSATLERYSERAAAYSPADEALALGENTVLKRRGDAPAPGGDMLSDEVLGRYRLYASELAQLRERRDRIPEPRVPV